jgi:hypothetical protein
MAVRLELRKAVMHHKVANAEVAAKDVVVLAAKDAEATAAVKDAVVAIVEAVAEAVDVKVETAVADLEISLDVAVMIKAETVAEVADAKAVAKEDADLNQFLVNRFQLTSYKKDLQINF